MSVSFKPSSFVSGGLKDDFDGKIVDCRAEYFDYNGTVDPVVAVKVTFEAFDNSGVFEQFYSFGPTRDWAPNEDDGGNKIEKIGTRENPVSNSNFHFFLSSLTALGFPEDKMTDQLSFLIGLSGHWLRKPAPERSGINNQKKEQGRTDTILVLAKKLTWPWEKAGTAGAPANAARPAARTAVRTASNTRTAVPAASVAPVPTSQASEPVATPQAPPDGQESANLADVVSGMVDPGAPAVEYSHLKRAVFTHYRTAGVNPQVCNYNTNAMTHAYLIENGYMVEGDGPTALVSRL